MSSTNDYVQKQTFSQINLSDEFFDSLKLDYNDFEEWFKKKAAQDAEAYVMYHNNKVSGFMYLKEETEPIQLEKIELSALRRLKIGTFKLNSHGTVLGERFLAIALRYAVENDFERVYVTVFEEHQGIISLFEKFGFEKAGNFSSGELFLGKRLGLSNRSPYLNFPKVQVTQPAYSLSIQPEFHTKLFPDSKLITEKEHVIEDLALTNTLSKTYLTNIPNARVLKSGDLLFIYRIDEKEPKRFHSVITSVCTVTDLKNIREFPDFETYRAFIGKGTIFSEQQLINFWRSKTYDIIIKMVYNFPMKKKVILDDFSKIIEKPIKGTYWGFVEFTNEQAEKLLEKGKINESFIIH